MCNKYNYNIPGDNDLVGLIVLEMLEICTVGSSDWVNVLVTVMNLVLLPLTEKKVEKQVYIVKMVEVQKTHDIIYKFLS